MPGPPPTPSNIVKLRGNPGHRPINEDAPTPDPVLADPPAHLDRRTADKWREVAPKLYAVGCLTEVDLDDLERYCVAWVKYWDCEAMVKLEGFTIETARGVTINPHVRIQEKLSNELQRFSDRFAFNPAYRTKVKAEKPVQKTNKFDR